MTKLTAHKWTRLQEIIEHPYIEHSSHSRFVARCNWIEGPEVDFCDVDKEVARTSGDSSCNEETRLLRNL